jgi:hypothetical protein
MPRTDLERRLALAKARLDGLDLYPQPVQLKAVRVAVVPWLFRLPGLRGYDGYALWQTILLRRADAPDDLLTHELCHIWQIQQRPLSTLLAWPCYSHAKNPFEHEAEQAVKLTRLKPFPRARRPPRPVASRPQSGKISQKCVVQQVSNRFGRKEAVWTK